MSHAAASWLNHPRAEALLRFNFLPSMLVHPSRLAQRLPAAFASMSGPGAAAIGQPILHRHWSATLRREMSLGTVDSLEDAVLPLAMLDRAAFELLTLWCGIAVLAPAIRRVIMKDEVAALASEFGEAGLSFARHQAPAQPLGAQVQLTAGAAGNQARRLGESLMSVAFEAASAEVGSRARLRLSPEAGQARGELPPAWGQAPVALTVCRRALEILDNPWLSSFPARH
jgi:hypothetical protein